MSFCCLSTILPYLFIFDSCQVPISLLCLEDRVCNSVKIVCPDFLLFLCLFTLLWEIGFKNRWCQTLLHTGNPKMQNTASLPQKCFLREATHKLMKMKGGSQQGDTFLQCQLLTRRNRLPEFKSFLTFHTNSLCLWASYKPHHVRAQVWVSTISQTIVKDKCLFSHLYYIENNSTNPKIKLNGPLYIEDLKWCSCGQHYSSSG